MTKNVSHDFPYLVPIEPMPKSERKNRLRWHAPHKRADDDETMESIEAKESGRVFPWPDVEATRYEDLHEAGRVIEIHTFVLTGEVPERGIERFQTRWYEVPDPDAPYGHGTSNPLGAARRQIAMTAKKNNEKAPAKKRSLRKNLLTAERSKLSGDYPLAGLCVRLGMLGLDVPTAMGVVEDLGFPIDQVETAQKLGPKGVEWIRYRVYHGQKGWEKRMAPVNLTPADEKRVKSLASKVTVARKEGYQALLDQIRPPKPKKAKAPAKARAKAPAKKRPAKAKAKAKAETPAAE